MYKHPKTYSFLVFWLTSVLFTTSCSRTRIYADELETPRVAVELSPQISYELTRAGGSEWDLGDAIGVFMLKHGASLQSGRILDEADNRCYLTASSGAGVSLSPAGDDQVMYYPVDGSAVDFIAYYPYRPAGTGPGMLDRYVYPVRVADQSSFSNFDLLYATGSGSKTNKTVVLNFTHQLSKIRVTLRKGAELPNLDMGKVNVVLGGMPVASGFALENATFDYRNEAGQKEVDNIMMQATTGAEIYEALVLPQPSGMFTGRSITIEPGDGNEGFLQSGYEWFIPDGTVFRSGKEYTYTFTLRGSGVEFGSLTITDWDDYSFEAAALEMVPITGGTFLMGSLDEAGRRTDEVRHEVGLDDYMISRFPVTNAQYAAFLNATQVPAGGRSEGQALLAVPHPVLSCSSTMVDGATIYRWRIAPGKENHPVTSVNWFGASVFAGWQGGSLPTEAQWEYACRAGSQTAYGFGNEVSRLYRHAWYAANNNTGAENSIGTKEAGKRLMSAFALYDMHGNVWEWCADWYEAYTIPAVANPVGGNPASNKRVLRGGAFDSPAEDCRAAARYSDTPGSAEANYGFRIVLKRNGQ